MEPTPSYRSRPAVVTWYSIYCWAMAVLYILCFLGGLAVLILPAETLKLDPVEKAINGVVFAGLGLPLTVAFIIGALTPPRKWAWIYGIILIALGMTSCCCLPACIPLLIYWLKPEVKTYFGAT